MADKRGYMRYPVADCVCLKDEAGAPVASNATLNGISFKGMSLELKEKIETGKIVQFEFTANLLGIFLVGKAVVKNITEIKRKEEQIFRVGLEFMEVDKGDVSDLLSEIQRKAREKAGRVIPNSLPDYGPF